MKEKEMDPRIVKIPGPDHPIAISPSHSRIVVSVGGRIVADSVNALILQEAAYPAVHYIPRADVDMTALTRSETHSYCPYKGEASYFSIPNGGGRAVDAVWTYETPYEAVDAIKAYVAFYPDRVDAIEQRPI